MIAKQRLYSTADRKRAVPQNHPEARFLICVAGAKVSDAILKKYAGAEALAGKEADPAPERKPAPSAQKAQQAESKAHKSDKDDDKGKGGHK